MTTAATTGNLRDGVTGIVLAGGRSSRFGSDKLAAEIDGTTVLERAITAVAVVASEVIVAGQPAGRTPAIPETSIRMLPDAEPSGGPLRALAGVLSRVPGEGVPADVAIVVAGDMPSLVPDVLGLLVATVRASADTDAAVLGDPRDPSRLQPLPAALRVGPARAAAASALDAGDRSLVRLLGRLAVVEIPVERWQTIDPEAQTLVDVDVPGDLRRMDGGARDQRMR